MAYTRKGTSAEIFSGTETDVVVTPATLRANVWFYDGNSPSAEKDFGTLNDFDIPIIRNSVEKVRFDSTVWTTNTYTSNFKIGTNGNAGVIRFPFNSSVQHGIVATTGGALSFIVADGESSSSNIVATAIAIASNGNVGVGVAPSTGFDVLGALRFRTFSTTGNLLSVSNSSGNITSVTPAYILATGGAFIQSGNTFGTTAILGTNDAFGLAFETNNTQAIRIDTSQNVGIGTTNPQTRLHLNGGAFRQERTNAIGQFDVSANIDVDTPSEVVASVVLADFAAGFFDYVIYDDPKANMRAGTIQVVWSGIAVQYQEFSTLDIGDTNGVVFSAVINGANLEIVATVSSSNWIVKCMYRVLN